MTSQRNKLTPFQARILKEVRASGRRIYNGRAFRAIEVLEKAGLVVVDYDLAGVGGPFKAFWRITVTPTRAAQ